MAIKLLTTITKNYFSRAVAIIFSLLFFAYCQAGHANNIANSEYIQIETAIKDSINPKFAREVLIGEIAGGGASYVLCELAFGATGTILAVGPHGTAAGLVCGQAVCPHAAARGAAIGTTLAGLGSPYLMEGNGAEKETNSKKPSTNQLEQKVKKGQAPKTVERVDLGKGRFC